MEAGEKCWHCDYMLCRDCGARTMSAIVIYCAICRIRPEPAAGGGSTCVVAESHANVTDRDGPHEEGW